DVLLSWCAIERARGDAGVDVGPIGKPCFPRVSRPRVSQFGDEGVGAPARAGADDGHRCVGIFAGACGDDCAGGAGSEHEYGRVGGTLHRTSPSSTVVRSQTIVGGGFPIPNSGRQISGVRRPLWITTSSAPLRATSSVKHAT